MGSFILLAFIQNVFIFCMVFWLLTWVGSYYSTPREQYSKKQVYECGFKSISDLNLQVNLNFSLVCVFLILYDVEFTFLFPFLFNLGSVDGLALYLGCAFICLLILALAYDLSHSAANTTI